MNPPHLAISYVNTVPVEPFNAFRTDVANDGLDVTTEAREPDGFFAAVEWIVPSVVCLFILKTYFEGFLQEAGKEHYTKLKAATKKLTRYFIGPSAPRVTIVASNKNKISALSPRFSLLYSISVVVERGVVFKLLLEPDMEEADSDAAVELFLSFMAQFFDGTADTSAVKGLEGAELYYGNLLIAFNRAERSLYVFDPRHHSAPT